MANPFIRQQSPIGDAAQITQQAPMMSPDSMEIAKKQRMAKLLMDQGSQPVQGGEVSGRYVQPSWTQYLASGLSSYLGGKAQQDVDKSVIEFGQKQNQQRQQDLQRYADALRGTQEKTEEVGQTTNLPIGGVQPVVSEANKAALGDVGGVPNVSLDLQGFSKKTLAMPGNPQMAAQVLLQSQDPELRQLGMKQMMEQPKFGNAPHYDQQGRAFVVSDRGEIRYLDGVQARDKMELAPSGVAYNPYALQPGQVFNDPNKLMSIDQSGHAVINQPLLGAQQSIHRAGATNVNVAAPENKYNAQIGEDLAKANMALVQGAQAAPQTVTNARMIKDALDKGAITGTGANARLAVQKAMETAGLIGPGKAADTQALMSGLGKLTLSGIRTSGLGAGQGFTDKDREFLQSAISGQISDTPENLRRVADLSERAATLQHQQGRKLLQRWQSDPSLSKVASDFPLEDLPSTSPGSQNMPNGAPKAGAVQGGYVFLGGNPADPKSWRKQ